MAHGDGQEPSFHCGFIYGFDAKSAYEYFSPHSYSRDVNSSREDFNGR
jgi:hypothetical protein